MCHGTFHTADFHAFKLSLDAFNESFRVSPPEKNECPIDLYFTIDTSETIALQEPPPGSLVESIKVPRLSAILSLKTSKQNGSIL